MKLKKTFVSLLSVSTLVFSFGGAAAAQEVDSLGSNENVKSTMLDTTKSVASWGWWSPKKLAGNSVFVLNDSIEFGSGYAYGIDGYQESGSLGTPTVVYRLYEIKGVDTTSSEVWNDVRAENGYVYLSIPRERINPNKTYKLTIENVSNFQVELRGNAYTSSY